MARIIRHRVWRWCGLARCILMLSLVGLAPSGRVRALSPSPRWVEQGPLIAVSNTYLPRRFGSDVALSGDTAMVTERNPNTGAGAVDVFVRRGTTWAQQAALTVDVEGFGEALALSGDTALIGAARASNVLAPVYVFVRRGTTWTRQAVLQPHDGGYGSPVALSGDVALIGTPDANGGTGAADVFVRQGTTWIQQAVLRPSDGARGDAFGGEVALSGDTAVVGATDKHNQAGAAYMFARHGTRWSQQFEVVGTAPGDDVGASVGVSGATVLVGVVGAALIYVRQGTTWTRQAELRARQGTGGDYFGLETALDGDTALVGVANRNDDSGVAYVFVRRGATWTQQAALRARETAIHDLFGLAVALSGDSALIGAPQKNDDDGAAYVFVRR